MSRPTDAETAQLFVIRRGQKNPLTENERFLIDYIDKMADDLRETVGTLRGERKEHNLLKELLSRPEIDDFGQGIVTEAAHQRQRWGDAHDRSKSAENWFWLVGYLSGKALRASIEGDKAKAKHHTISAAAALFQWHQAIKSDETDRGIGADADISPEGGRLGTAMRALEESVKLQSHYAAILNAFDGGRRLTFGSSDEWIARFEGG